MGIATRQHVAAAYKRLVIVCGYSAHRNDKDMQSLVRLAHSQLARNQVKARELVAVFWQWPAHQPHRAQSTMVYSSMLWEMVAAHRAALRRVPRPQAPAPVIEPSSIQFFYNYYLENPAALEGMPLAWLSDGLILNYSSQLDEATRQVIRDNSKHKKARADRGQLITDLDNLETRITGRAKRLAALAYFESLKADGVKIII